MESPMYVECNFKTKKALKDAVAKGEQLRLFAPGMGSPAVNGKESVEGPWYPEPHRWYATVVVVNGIITKVS